MSALTMFANLKHWGGSNHLLVPTSVLYDLGPVVRAPGAPQPPRAATAGAPQPRAATGVSRQGEPLTVHGVVPCVRLCAHALRARASALHTPN